MSTRKLELLFAIAFAQATLFGQSETTPLGFVFNERIQGTGSTLGLITKFDTAIGYQFNRYLTVEGGAPIYFVNPSSSGAATIGTQSQSGLGNAYGDLRLSLPNPVVNYMSVLTISAPTGDKGTGFSTGHTTYDWTNLFDRSFDRLTPFVDLGIANTVADTPYFIRPFTSFGFITHFEGGATYKFWRTISVGSSVYAIAPSGQQTVISKLIPGKSNNPGPGGGGRGRHGHQGVFETAAQTTGSADIARDHGFSAWFSVSPSRYAVFEIGYSRSIQYALNGIFFGINFSLGPFLGRSH